jgi:hypothetical protein
MPRQSAAHAWQAPRAAPDTPLTRLLRRRRDWARTAGTASAGLAVFTALAAARLVPRPLHTAWLLAIDVLALTAAAGAGAALDETRFLWRAGLGARGAAAAGPCAVTGPAHRAPLHAPSWLGRLVALLALPVPAAVTLPRQAGAVAGLAAACPGFFAGHGGTGYDGYPAGAAVTGPGMILLLGVLLDALAAYSLTALTAQARNIVTGAAR